MGSPPIDLRDHARRTKRQLIAGGLILIFILGTVLIAVTYGTPAAACGLAFLLFAMIPVGLVSLVLYVLQWLVNRSEKGDS
jgi:cytochrome c oxidase assembly factor CtaG